MADKTPDQDDTPPPVPGQDDPAVEKLDSLGMALMTEIKPLLEQILEELQSMNGS